MCSRAAAGNCPESCVIEGAVAPTATATRLGTADERSMLLSPATRWLPLLPRTRLTPHHRHYFRLSAGELEACTCTHVRLTIFPDGGVSRLRVVGRAVDGDGDAPRSML